MDGEARIMTRIVVTAKVGPDGVLHLTLPLATGDANREVQITVEPVRPPTMSQEEWRQFILRTVGSIPDPTFRRHEQGEYEERDPLRSKRGATPGPCREQGDPQSTGGR
jgi:hypothetical protein